MPDADGVPPQALPYAFCVSRSSCTDTYAFDGRMSSMLSSSVSKGIHTAVIHIKQRHNDRGTTARAKRPPLTRSDSSGTASTCTGEIVWDNTGSTVKHGGIHHLPGTAGDVAACSAVLPGDAAGAAHARRHLHQRRQVEAQAWDLQRLQRGRRAQ